VLGGGALDEDQGGNGLVMFPRSGYVFCPQCGVPRGTSLDLQSPLSTDKNLEDGMVTFAELHAQNHKITELSNVFLYLIRDRAMCDTEVACDLFFDYAKKVREHVDLVDKQLCGRLISYPDQAVKNTADRFMSGSAEIKRIFASYLKDWCSEKHKELNVRNHERFVQETNQMFTLVLERIQRETEHLYPLIRRLEEKALAA
jgi:hypothetical protein